MRRRGRQNDQGSASVLVLPAAMAAVALTVLLVVGLGGASQTRRGATTAADAAALAAAQEWRDRIGGQYALDTSTDGTVPSFAGRELGDLLGGARSRARELAVANDAVLESFDVDPARAEVTVTTRTSQQFAGTTRDFRASAVARIELRSGACRDGATLGLMVSGCVSSAAEAAALELTMRDVSSFEAVVTLVR